MDESADQNVEEKPVVPMPPCMSWGAVSDLCL